ncbi:MAG: cytochrome c3 family protein [Planctomycetes bacterium]|nr:cytochrome c3 family protein [Planctomycetota bacterium]
MRSPLRSALLAGVVGATAVAAVACMRFPLRAPALPSAPGPAVAAAPAGPRFNHPLHADNGLECVDCHFPEKDGKRPAEPLAPTWAQCSDCHDENDADGKKLKDVLFSAGNAPKWTAALAKYDGEIKFAHGPHAAKVACATCHADVMKADAPRKAGLMFSMDGCMACHAQKGARNTCETCHSQISQSVPPESHRFLWKQRHGEASRAAASSRDGSCTLCHADPNFCERCHDIEEPKDHTHLFRIRAHGAMAALDRRRCQTCHETDYCVRCHEETAPMSHRGLWARGPSTHCANCHFPIGREESCRVCHEEPEHETAPDQPPTHVPGMNCRLCHNPVGQFGAPPLKHIDNGSQCERCHK